MINREGPTVLCHHIRHSCYFVIIFGTAVGFSRIVTCSTTYASEEPPTEPPTRLQRKKIKHAKHLSPGSDQKFNNTRSIMQTCACCNNTSMVLPGVLINHFFSKRSAPGDIQHKPKLILLHTMIQRGSLHAMMLYYAHAYRRRRGIRQGILAALLGALQVGLHSIQSIFYY